MSTVTDLSFVNGDLELIEVSPGVFDVATVSDNAAVVQAVALQLDLQRGVNQYFPSSGWDLMRWQGADLSQSDADELCADIRKMLLRIAYVTDAEVSYLGNTSDEADVAISVTSRFGTESILYSLGGLS